MKLSDFYEQVENKLTQSENDKKNHILKLDKVPNSNVAVYQTVQNDKNDDIKKEVSLFFFFAYNEWFFFCVFRHKIFFKKPPENSNFYRETPKKLSLRYFI